MDALTQTVREGGRVQIVHADENDAFLTPDDVSYIHEHLAPIEVWPPEAVDQSLGIAEA